MRTIRCRVAARCRAPRHTLQGPGLIFVLSQMLSGLTLQGFATHCRARRRRHSFWYQPALTSAPLFDCTARAETKTSRPCPVCVCFAACGSQ